MLCVHREKFFRMFDRWPNDDVAAVGARYRTAHQDDFVGFTHLEDLKVLHRHPLVAEVTRHAHVFPNPAGGGTIADGAVAAVGLGPVSCSLSGEVVLLHHALEAFTLGTSDDINVITCLK